MCANAMFMIQQAVHDLGVQYESGALTCMFLICAVNICVAVIHVDVKHVSLSPASVSVFSVHYNSQGMKFTKLVAISQLTMYDIWLQDTPIYLCQTVNAI